MCFSCQSLVTKLTVRSSASGQMYLVAIPNNALLTILPDCKVKVVCSADKLLLHKICHDKKLCLDFSKAISNLSASARISLYRGSLYRGSTVVYRFTERVFGKLRKYLQVNLQYSTLVHLMHLISFDANFTGKNVCFEFHKTRCFVSLKQQEWENFYSLYLAFILKIFGSLEG